MITLKANIMEPTPLIRLYNIRVHLISKNVAKLLFTATQTKISLS